MSVKNATAQDAVLGGSDPLGLMWSQKCILLTSVLGESSHQEGLENVALEVLVNRNKHHWS